MHARPLMSLVLIALLFSAGCSSTGRPDASSATGTVSVRVAPFPVPFKRAFFATLHVSGHRVTAVGQMDVRTPYDFRMTAATELGDVLFDVRYNWAGCHVLRAAPRFPSPLAVVIATDLSHALRLPDSSKPTSMAVRNADGSHTVNYKDGEDYPTVYLLNAGLAPVRQELRYGAFDKLTVRYGTSPRGELTELRLDRPAKNYKMAITFTAP